MLYIGKLIRWRYDEEGSIETLTISEINEETGVVDMEIKAYSPFDPAALELVKPTVEYQTNFAFASHSHYLKDGVPKQRPRVHPIPTTGKAPEVIDFTDYPKDSRIHIRNEDGDKFIIGPEQAMFTHAGKYNIWVETPDPWIGAEGTLVLK